MFYVITKQGVIASKSLSKINKKLNVKLDNVELQNVGNDCVVNVSDKDLDFLQDKRILSKIPMSNLYKSDNMTKYLIIAIFICQFILMIKK